MRQSEQLAQAATDGVCSDSLNSVGRQHQREPTALADCALDSQFTPMALGHVLDDGQPEPRATGVARAAAVDTVEAFGEPGKVLCGNARAGVTHLDFARTVRTLTPADLHLAALRCVADRVGNEVGDGTQQLSLAARELDVVTPVEARAVPAGGQPVCVHFH